MKRARTPRDHNAFAKRRRLNMRAGETPAQARARWASDGRCRDCGGALIGDGATGARCGGCRRGADRPPRAGQLKTILLLCADRGVERDAPATEAAPHELIKALAALPKRVGGRGGAMAGKCGSRGLFAEAGQRLEAELARAAQTFAGSGGGASPAKDGAPGLRVVGGGGAGAPRPLASAASQSNGRLRKKVRTQRADWPQAAKICTRLDRWRPRPPMRCDARPD